MSAQKRQSFEERTEMDERLTSKHIRTLLHLQDVNGEAAKLKQRIAYLEVCEVKAKKCDFFEQELEHLKVQNDCIEKLLIIHTYVTIILKTNLQAKILQSSLELISLCILEVPLYLYRHFSLVLLVSVL